MKNESIVFVCYVQNYMGILDGEDVISCMMVTQSQERIDRWLAEQVKEAEEIGYIPEEDIDTFIGMNDYEIVVSKGNEKEGFECYGIICKPVFVEAD